MGYKSCKVALLHLQTLKYGLVIKNRRCQKKGKYPLYSSKIKTAACVCSHTWWEQMHAAVLILDVYKGYFPFFDTGIRIQRVYFGG